MSWVTIGISCKQAEPYSRVTMVIAHMNLRLQHFCLRTCSGMCVLFQHHTDLERRIKPSLKSGQERRQGPVKAREARTTINNEGSEPRDLRPTRVRQETCKTRTSQSNYKHHKRNKIKQGRIHLRQHLLPCNLCKGQRARLRTSAISAHFLVDASERLLLSLSGSKRARAAKLYC
jgi:hypothetical protein